jgi:hypothetical protein
MGYSSKHHVQHLLDLQDWHTISSPNLIELKDWLDQCSIIIRVISFVAIIPVRNAKQYIDETGNILFPPTRGSALNKNRRRGGPGFVPQQRRRHRFRSLSCCLALTIELNLVFRTFQDVRIAQ